MHRSRIGIFLIDHPPASEPVATAFWSSVIGGSPDGHTVTDDEPYASIGLLGAGLRLETQRVGAGTVPRVHLDIETDDVEAETTRLVELGANVFEVRDGYRIMTDPGGLVFCVVPVQTATFDEHALTWP